MKQDQSPISRKQVVEHPVPPDEGFDTRTHIRDSKSGALIRVQPYALHCNGDDKMFEQPIGSGNMFNQAGHPMGQFKKVLSGKNQSWEKVSPDHTKVQYSFDVLSKEEHIERLSTEKEAILSELEALKAERQKSDDKAESQLAHAQAKQDKHNK